MNLGSSIMLSFEKKQAASYPSTSNYSHIYLQKVPMRFHISMILCISVLIFGCKPDQTQKTPELNLELSKQIDKMANRDKQMQINVLQFASVEEGEFNEIENLRSQVYEMHAKEIKIILDQYGYPGYDLVGKKSTDNFFTLMQHTVDFPEVMKLGIEKMEDDLRNKQIEPYQYISLKDQYAVLKEIPQPYGTIVRFDEQGKSFVDNPSIDIEKNRAEIGIDSLELYLDRKTMQYFEFNQEELARKGIEQPILNR